MLVPHLKIVEKLKLCRVILRSRNIYKINHFHFQETSVDEAEQQNTFHLPAANVSPWLGRELQRRLPPTVAGPGHRGTLWGFDPNQMHPLPRVHVRGLVYRGKVLHAEGLDRHRRQNHMARYSRIRSQSNDFWFAMLLVLQKGILFLCPFIGYLSNIPYGFKVACILPYVSFFSF